MRFVEIVRVVKTKNVSLPKISMFMEIVNKILPQLCSNDSIQILLEMANLNRICMGSSEHNRSNISSLIVGRILNFGMEALCILFFLNVTTKFVISQIKFL